jgi:uncharacterized membrane protein HdeD (DUF308 family)
MSTAIVTALIVFLIASVISFGVALLIKGIFLAIRKVNTPRQP